MTNYENEDRIMDEPTDKQIEIYKAMTPQQRLKIALDMYQMARKLKAAGLRMSHPDWNEEQVQKAVRDIFLYART